MNARSRFWPIGPGPWYARPTMADPREPESGEIIAEKYMLTRELGRGGMGSVWEGVHQTLNRKVAVKFIDTRIGQEEEMRRRFINEAVAAASLKSKHVVQVYDHGVTSDGRLYMVMEFLSGETLEARLERTGPMSVEAFCEVLLPASRALTQAHAAGIIHRDLKPENIFLDWDDEDQRDLVKIVDFGVAKLTENQGTSNATATGIFLGTPSYMSPEQARGLAVDGRADIWSLGVVAYECLSGQMPFNGQSVGDLLFTICSKDPPPISQFAKLPAGIDAWMARSLARDPADRFSTTDEQAAALVELSRTSALPGSLRASGARLLNQRLDNAHQFGSDTIATDGSPPPPTPTPPSDDGGGTEAGLSHSIVGNSVEGASGHSMMPMTNETVPAFRSRRGRIAAISIGAAAAVIGGVALFVSSQAGGAGVDSELTAPGIAETDGLAPAAAAAPSSELGQLQGLAASSGSRMGGSMPPEAQVTPTSNEPSAEELAGDLGDGLAGEIGDESGDQVESTKVNEAAPVKIRKKKPSAKKKVVRKPTQQTSTKPKAPKPPPTPSSLPGAGFKRRSPPVKLPTSGL